MAKLKFTHATMKAGKSLDALKEARGCEENGTKVVTMAPFDERANGNITTRFKPDDYPGEGIERQLDIVLHSGQSPLKALGLPNVDMEMPGLLVVDEGQFLDGAQVEELAVIAHIHGIEVSAYGLLNNFKGELFLGSSALVAWADVLEAKTRRCTVNKCSRDANQNARLVDGELVFTGEEVAEDGIRGVAYQAICNLCYLRAKKGERPKIGR